MTLINQCNLGDCLEVMRGMPENSVDSIVTDPPYGLSFMGKKWDYDVPSTEIWAECLRVKKFRAEMGDMFPEWWSEASPHEVADAAIKAVMEFRP